MLQMGTGVTGKAEPKDGGVFAPHLPSPNPPASSPASVLLPLGHCPGYKEADAANRALTKEPR